jgi:hypothetical protein
MHGSGEVSAEYSVVELAVNQGSGPVPWLIIVAVGLGLFVSFVRFRGRQSSLAVVAVAIFVVAMALPASVHADEGDVVDFLSGSFVITAGAAAALVGAVWDARGGTPRPRIRFFYALVFAVLLLAGLSDSVMWSLGVIVPMTLSLIDVAAQGVHSWRSRGPSRIAASSTSGGDRH